ncbi:hypothetical protein BH23GEM11_BH23GEM11_15590 [soil metagenome]
MLSMTIKPSSATRTRPRAKSCVGVLAAALPLGLLLLAPSASLEAATLSETELAPAGVEAVAPGPETAAELEARAWAMRDQVDRRREAARLYRQAADLREVSDPMKVESLREASRMSFYAGRTHRALADASEAARLALRQGDVVVAAHIHMDAAWLAAELGDAATAGQHLADARMLAASPLLAQSQRVDLLSRLAAPA